MSIKLKFPLKEVVGIDMLPRHCAFVIEYIKDWDHRRAAACCGYDPDQGSTMLKRDDVQHAIAHIMESRLQGALPDAEWVLHELVDNHFLARQKDQLSASNQALALIAKHNAVDAFAADKVHIVGHAEVVARLQRARMRTIPGEVIKDDPVQELSFF